jgi:hypothetical protein
MKNFWLFVFTITTCLPLSAQNNRRDGNWWIQETPTERASFVLGFLDGVHLGHQFSFWTFYKKDNACFKKVAESYDFHFDKYLSNVTVGQLSDGLDTFYKDYRNRKIRIEPGVWLTLNSIAGTPQAEVDKMVEDFRKNAD